MQELEKGVEQPTTWPAITPAHVLRIPHKPRSPARSRCSTRIEAILLPKRSGREESASSADAHPLKTSS